MIYYDLYPNSLVENCIFASHQYESPLILKPSHVKSAIE